MKNWQEVYTKNIDNKVFKEFKDDYYNNWGISPLLERTIRDVFGHIVCFAETKEVEINVVMIDDVIEGWVSREMQGFDKAEQAMFWCAEKFFEVAKLKKE